MNQEISLLETTIEDTRRNADTLAEKAWMKSAFCRNEKLIKSIKCSKTSCQWKTGGIRWTVRKKESVT